MKKRAVSFILVLAVCFGCMVPAIATEGTNNTENGPVLVLSQASKDFMTRMFEKDGYTILRDDGTDVTETFYADMTVEFEHRNFDAISDYLFDNNLTVCGPTEITDVEEPSLAPRYSAILTEKNIHKEGDVVVNNAIGTFGTEAQKFVWMLDSAVTYDDESGRFVSATGPHMRYNAWYEVYEQYRYVENKSKTVAKPYSDSVGFSFETEILAEDYFDDGWVSKFHGLLSERWTLTYSAFLAAK